MGLFGCRHQWKLRKGQLVCKKCGALKNPRGR